MLFAQATRGYVFEWCNAQDVEVLASTVKGIKEDNVVSHPRELVERLHGASKAPEFKNLVTRLYQESLWPLYLRALIVSLIDL